MIMKLLSLTQMNDKLSSDGLVSLFHSCGSAAALPDILICSCASYDFKLEQGGARINRLKITKEE